MLRIRNLLSGKELWALVLLVGIGIGMSSCHSTGSSVRSKHRKEHVIKKSKKKKAKKTKKGQKASKETGNGMGKGIDKKTAKMSIGQGTRMERAIAEEAVNWIGTPYRYACSDKGSGADCSGMVMQVYLDVTGKAIPRNSAKQAEYCKSIKQKDVRVGDLVFFATGKSESRISHVGIMINDTQFVHSSTSRGVVVTDITEPYWTRTFMGFGRVP